MHRHPILTCLLALLVPAGAAAQERKPPVTFEKVRVGFRSYVAEEGSRFKVGLWAPVHIDLLAGNQGLASPAKLEIEAPDSEDVGTVFPLEVRPLDKLERRSFLGYIKPGNSGGDIQVRLQSDDLNLRGPQEGHLPLELNTYLYLTLGNRLPELQEALVSLAEVHKLNENMGRSATWPRFAAWESEVPRLPTEWFGYNSVDLVIVTTSNKPFIDELLLPRHRSRLSALAQWVRRGGRLVVSVSWRNQDLVAALLGSPAWQPPLPVVPPADQPDPKKSSLKRLLKVEKWAEIHDKPFPGLGQPPMIVANLNVDPQSGKRWEVQADTADGRPLIARMSYGLGQVTFLAFELDQPPFSLWEGRKAFCKALVEKLGPFVQVDPRFAGQAFGGRQVGNEDDVATQLQYTLENFDVKVVSFGWVVIFILLYIIVVGPLDYLFLKNVLRRLEWTWITFPAVVLLVSLVAYFTAYALKGSELRINQIDIIDFDLCTALDRQQRPRQAQAYGQTFVTLLSPRIQSYTLGLEPVVGQWLGQAQGQKPASADLISWLGRPDYDVPWGMGRRRSQGPFQRRPYEYVEQEGEGQGIRGLQGIHMPVWTSKAFTASWEQTLPSLPLATDLYYHQDAARAIKVSGTVQNLLPFDLEDVWLFYRDRCYALDDKLPGAPQGSPLKKVALEVERAQEVRGWTSLPERASGQVRRLTKQGTYWPTPIVKKMFFQERAGAQRNHGLRPLDWSWRLSDNQPGDGAIREAILYARLAPQSGQFEDLSKQLPARLWLGDLPAANRSRPGITGLLVQDTYVRFLIPLRSADN